MLALIDFLAAIGRPLADLLEHIAGGGNDEAKEREIALSIVFAAKRLQAEKEL